MLFPADAGTPSPPADDRHSDIAGGGAPEIAGGGGYRGSATGEAQWLIGLWMAGRGIAVPPSSSDAAGQSVDITGGWERKPAGRGRVSGTAVHLWKSRLGTQGGGRIADRMPGTGDHTLAVGRSANISVIFFVTYRGRLKRPHLHCRADAVA